MSMLGSQPISDSVFPTIHQIPTLRNVLIREGCLFYSKEDIEIYQKQLQEQHTSVWTRIMQRLQQISGLVIFVAGWLSVVGFALVACTMMLSSVRSVWVGTPIEPWQWLWDWTPWGAWIWLLAIFLQAMSEMFVNGPEWVCAQVTVNVSLPAQVREMETRIRVHFPHARFFVHYLSVKDEKYYRMFSVDSGDSKDRNVVAIWDENQNVLPC
ncbi:MAG: hypothetical protein HYR90_00675 [Candidatus Andersenbacteria bacterium]|nr:hypothetical protein [Candidatus Andersenbacteria bacterium]